MKRKTLTGQRNFVCPPLSTRLGRERHQTMQSLRSSLQNAQQCCHRQHVGQTFRTKSKRTSRGSLTRQWRLCCIAPTNRLGCLLGCAALVLNHQTVYLSLISYHQPALASKGERELLHNTLPQYAGPLRSPLCRAQQDPKNMGEKRILFLAHGKKAEDPKFQEAYRWLEQDGHDIELIKTGSEADMGNGVQKLVSNFDSERNTASHLPSAITVCTIVCPPAHAKAPSLLWKVTCQSAQLWS